MSNTSVVSLSNVAKDVKTTAERINAEVGIINNKLSKLEEACSKLSTYNNQVVAEDPTIKSVPIPAGTWQDENYRYLKLKQEEYEQIWEITGYEEGLEATKYVKDSLKESVDEIKKQSEYVAAVILDVAQEIAKNEKATEQEMIEAQSLRTIADFLKKFSESKSIEVGYQKVDEGQKFVDTAAEYIGKIPYHIYDSHKEEFNPADCGKPLPDGSLPKSGLDCSGFVAYAYYKSTGKKLCYSEEDGYLMCGTKTIWDASTPISKSELKPGDVAFLHEPSASGTNHIGIYYGKDKNGKDLWIHENAQDGNVSCNDVDYWGNRGKSKDCYRRIK